MTSSRPVVLVVEDQPDTLEGVATLLDQHGFAVTRATDGQQAFDLLEGGLRPQVMLVDLLLPCVSGSELIRYIGGDPDLREVPIVVLTGAPRERVNVVADRVLYKPLDPSELLATIRTLCHRAPESGRVS